jgi:hypothetical protein
VIGVAIAGYGAYDYQRQSTMISNTSSVDATITQTGITTVNDRRGRTNYDPSVTFEYQFQGNSYVGDDIHPSFDAQTYESRSNAESVLHEYEEGETVTAYVHPSSPGEAFLVDEISNETIRFILIGLSLICVGGVVILRNRWN